MRPVYRLDLPLHLDRGSPLPLHRQLADALRGAVLDGTAPPGTRLPSTRQLGREVGVARATVLAAYEQLTGEGCLQARAGAGTFVSPHVVVPAAVVPAVAPLHPAVRAARPASTGPVLVDLRPGYPDVTGTVDPAWRRAWREAAADVPSVEAPAQGAEGFREEVAAHLRAARGVAARAEDVFVTAGADEGLGLVVHALGLRGAGVAVEDPGYPSARRCLLRLGADLHPVPVDGQGVRVDRLGAVDASVRAVLLTPSHQYPLGGVLPLDRRLAVLDWARDRGAVVVEDDYDSEFRYGAAPLPALAGLDPDRVVHVGTFSKVLTPWLRAGFLLVPAHLRPAFAAVRDDLGTPVSGLVQQALARYLAAGALRRHTARRRRDYAHRRAHLLRLLADVPTLTPTPTTAGLHAVVALPAGSCASVVLDRVRARGYLLADLDDYAVTPASRPGPAVVLGYARARLGDLDGVVRALAAATA